MKQIKDVLLSASGAQTYANQLRDERWRNRSWEHRKTHNFCNSCRRSDVRLGVHHVNYHRGVTLWEAADTDLVTLCESCHTLISGVIEQLRSTASRCNAGNIAKIALLLQLALRKHGEIAVVNKLARIAE